MFERNVKTLCPACGQRIARRRTSMGFRFLALMPYILKCKVSNGFYHLSYDGPTTPTIGKRYFYGVFTFFLTV